MGDSVNVWDHAVQTAGLAVDESPTSERVETVKGPLYDEPWDLPEQEAEQKRKLSRSLGRGPTPQLIPLTPRQRTPVRFQWMEREASRTPMRFRERVIAQFISPENLRYLRGVFSEMVPPGQMRKFALDTLYDAVYNFDRAKDILESDPIAQRGQNRPADDMWSEVRRLNRLFFSDRMKFLRENASIVEKGDRKMKRGPRDYTEDEHESYHMRMFIADSLRPPGLEHLNTSGPLYALREDQANSERAPPGPRGKALKELFEGKDKPREGFQSRTPESSAWASTWQPLNEDDGWDEGNPNRTPSQAVEEYWGDGYSESEKPSTEATMLGAQQQWNPSYGEIYAWGDKWLENGGTRFMRYERPPFWQKGGREGYDYEINETLGTGERELDAQVRRWDMDRVRNPRGQEYRRYGARSNYVV